MSKISRREAPESRRVLIMDRRSQTAELDHVHAIEPARRISSLYRNKTVWWILRNFSSHKTLEWLADALAVVQKPFKTRSGACPITGASVADHKMLPDLSHTHTQTHCSWVKMLPVNLHLSCEHYFFEVQRRGMIYGGISTALALALHHERNMLP